MCLKTQFSKCLIVIIIKSQASVTCQSASHGPAGQCSTGGDINDTLKSLLCKVHGVHRTPGPTVFT